MDIYILEKEKIVKKVVKTLALSRATIENILPHTDNYIVPYCQRKSGRYAIILYNEMDREGAYEEAENMNIACQTAGFTVLQVNWSKTSEMVEWINTLWVDIKEKCSLLSIFVMCHGHRGVLRGSENSMLSVNGLLLLTTDTQAPKRLTLSKKTLALGLL